ncbi:hypothetical protein EV714DRAFT_240424 [Schizophyllum commune]
MHTFNLNPDSMASNFLLTLTGPRRRRLRRRSSSSPRRSDRVDGYIGRRERRATGLIDAHTDVGASSHGSAECAVKTTPPSSPDAVAVGLRIRPRRDSQAWETGGSVLGATVRSWGEESGPVLAMPNESGHRDRR